MDSHGKNGQKMKHILIVDDNSFLRKTLLHILNTKFPQAIISEAATGAELWDIIKKWLPDLVFMDINLAKENGLELTREIKTKHPDVTVVIFTNHDLEQYKDQANACGAQYLLSKFDSSVEDLTTLVSGIIYK